MFDDEGFEDYESLINLPIDPGPPNSRKLNGSASEMFDNDQQKHSIKPASRRHAAKYSSDFVYASNSKRRKNNYSTSSSSISSNPDAGQSTIGIQKGIKQNPQINRLVPQIPNSPIRKSNSISINKSQPLSTTSQSRNKRKPIRTNSQQTYSNLPKPSKLSRYHSNQEGISDSFVDEELDLDDSDIEDDDDLDLPYDIEPYPSASSMNASDKYRWSGNSRSLNSRGSNLHSSSSGISRKSDIQISPGNEDRRLMHNAQERKRRGIIKKLKKELEGILPERLKRSVLGEAFKPDQSLSNPDISRCLEAYTKEISVAFAESDSLKEKWKRLKNALDAMEGSSNSGSSAFNF